MIPKEIEILRIILLIILIIIVAIYAIKYPENKLLLTINIGIIASYAISIVEYYDNYKVKRDDKNELQESYYSKLNNSRCLII